MITFVGDNDWLQQQLTDCVLASESDDVLLFSEQANHDNKTVHGKNYRQYLGTEQSLVVFEAYDDFNVDAFAALSGTIVAGGIVILAIEQSLLNKSSFVRYFIDKAELKPDIYVIHQVNGQPTVPDLEQSDRTLEQAQLNHPKLAFDCKTDEQRTAVEKILHVVSGHRDRPLVLTADRGRGKSTALALATIELLKQDNKQLIITAPHSESLFIFFKQLEASLPQAIFSKHSVTLGSSRVKFIPLDVLIKESPSCHLLMVDEAAGVPLPMLRILLATYHRQVFVSTIHGYEGAGRGFSTKFINEMKRLKPQSQHYHINVPIRWAVGDYLEDFIFDSLLLAATLPKANLNAETAIEYVDITGKELGNTPVLLIQTFALLVTAHYQTKPSDLKMLLDNEQVRLVLQMQNNHLVGVVLLLEEGGINHQLSTDIKQSLRRLKGHFSPQSLLVHCGAEQAFDYKYQRIVRIAIHPELQRLGLGNKLVNQCKRVAMQQGSDFITSSFGANTQLLNFWLMNNFNLARIGFSKDKASGEHSALVLHNINPEHKSFTQTITANFHLDFNYLMSDEYQYLAVDLMLLLVKQLPSPYITLDHQQAITDKQTVLDFSHGYRIFSCCAPALQRTIFAKIHTGQLSVENLSISAKILIRKVIQQQSWSEIYEEFNLTGKKQTLQLMKEFFTN